MSLNLPVKAVICVVRSIMLIDGCPCLAFVYFGQFAEISLKLYSCCLKLEYIFKVTCIFLRIMFFVLRVARFKFTADQAHITVAACDPALDLAEIFPLHRLLLVKVICHCLNAHLLYLRHLLGRLLLVF